VRVQEAGFRVQELQAEGNRKQGTGNRKQELLQRRWLYSREPVPVSCFLLPVSWQFLNPEPCSYLPPSLA
jgi:hypothetical protein